MKKVLSHLSFMKTLFEASAQDYKEATVEVGVSVFFSTIPIWFGAFLMLIDPRFASYGDNLLWNLRNGELYLYSTAALAPLYYFLFKNYAAGPTFPELRNFMLVATVIVLFAAGFFAFRRSREIAGLDAPVDEPFILAWSVILYVLAVMLVFVASVHRNFLDNAAAQTQRSGTDDFLEEYQTRKKGVRR